MTRKVRKAIFPVGGLGTRFLPATKAMPKEMLPVVDKPLIQYAVEEALAAGIEEIIFVTGRGKTAIEDHFDRSFELEETLKSRGIKANFILDIPHLSPGSIAYTRQQEPLGLGHAVWCARHFIQEESFAVLLADDLIHSSVPCLRQMIDAYNSCDGGMMMAVMDVDPAHVDRYGIVDIASEQGPLVTIRDLVEKPRQETAPSHVAIVGRYILNNRIFSLLDQKKKGAGGEIQLTDALRSLIPDEIFYGFRFEGKRYDCGSKTGFLIASLAVALSRPDLSAELKRELRDSFPSFSFDEQCGLKE